MLEMLLVVSGSKSSRDLEVKEARAARVERVPSFGVKECEMEVPLRNDVVACPSTPRNRTVRS